MKRKVAFQIDAPGAKQVLVAGDFTNWESGAKRMPKKRGKKVVFSTSLMLSPGTYEYKFIVDGEWREDPAAESRENLFGTRNSLITVT
ncbi:MAG: glycoside hydrolase [Armatimonadetes bacterium]|nr:glycoside hydrolase [Armatimonadota bacterium]NIM24440.1 glycoside hydrolase [Armatimonadota bacterium]NIM68311.1 glycoside hydrolase [Armatimonadota bacterium]NIM76715.1 glycoside hydrolase [Armatimonadota bacterium]NIN06514.1 glycoside hydrolase [Armatimonadota bacterium]